MYSILMYCTEATKKFFFGSLCVLPFFPDAFPSLVKIILENNNHKGTRRSKCAQPFMDFKQKKQTSLPAFYFKMKSGYLNDCSIYCCISFPLLLPNLVSCILKNSSINTRYSAGIMLRNAAISSIPRFTFSRSFTFSRKPM